MAAPVGAKQDQADSRSREAGTQQEPNLWKHSLHAAQICLGSENPHFSGLVDRALPSSHSVPYTVLDTMRTKEVLLPVLEEFDISLNAVSPRVGFPYHLHVNHQGHLLIMLIPEPNPR